MTFSEQLVSNSTLLGLDTAQFSRHLRMSWWNLPSPSLMMEASVPPTHWYSSTKLQGTMWSWSHCNSCVFRQGRTSPATSSSSFRECHCDCSTRQTHTPMTSLTRSDIVAGLVDNEYDRKHVQLQGCERCSWLDELNEFRQSHWFDCHAYPRESYISRDASRNLDGWSDHTTSHKCMYVKSLSLLRLLRYRRFVHRPLRAWYWHLGYIWHIMYLPFTISFTHSME
jgi:hypothetical protein